MEEEEHIKRHQELHKSLDELVADMIDQTTRTPSNTTVMELIKWSFEQTKNPTEKTN